MNLPGSPAACRVDRVAVNSAATSSQAAAASLSRADGVKSSLAQLADETGGAPVGWSPRGPPRTGASATSRPPAEPLLAALVDLLLPERHRLLERVDCVLAGGEGILAVRSRDGDRDARLADL